LQCNNLEQGASGGHGGGKSVIYGNEMHIYDVARQYDYPSESWASCLNQPQLFHCRRSITR